jgi:anti-anti-sigma factor
MGKENFKVITCEGDLSIENTKFWLEKFTKETKGTKDLRVSIKRIEKLDLSFIQLLIALKKTCDQEEIQFSLTGKLPDEVKKMFLVTGFFKKSNDQQN